LLHQSCLCWKHRKKASFVILWSLAIAFNLISSMVVKCVPLRPIFSLGNIQKSLGARSERTVVVWWQESFFLARNCYTTRDLWLGASSWYRNHCPCHLWLLPLNCIDQPLQNLHVELTDQQHCAQAYDLIMHHRC
jgi:hypothetical protein